ncbi:pentapeptide repeat-containing protein [Oceanospirillum maris]|uniref:pentapeptide repeat-containing protein n=1 Tax=Oceanospirillum maris TaxID=64977 RepID=UPI0004094889|nr:pentapeptide repeat-containing protein [Oceanospirillum maris]
MLPKKQKGLSRLSLFYGKTRVKSIRNKFYSKAQCFRANFSNTSFFNVNFKGAILTSCRFKNAEFSQVEFLGTNLKKSNFTDAVFKSCVFSAALLKNSNFKGCIFENCIFVNTNLKLAKNIVIDDSNRFYSQRPTPVVSECIMNLLDGLRFNSRIHNSRVLHLKGGKVNSLTLFSLLERLGEDKLLMGLKSLNGFLPYRIVTANGLCNVIDKAGRYR